MSYLSYVEKVKKLGILAKLKEYTRLVMGFVNAIDKQGLGGINWRTTTF